MYRESGFTLVELMLVVVVAAILLTVGVPPMRDMVQNNRITAQANDLLTAMTLARSEAIKLRTRVSVCASANQSTCTAVAPDWATGWIVFSDGATTGNPVVVDVLRVWGALSGDPALAAEDPGGNAMSFLRFLPNGTVQIPAVFTHTIPGCTGQQARTITVTAAGQARVARGACP